MSQKCIQVFSLSLKEYRIDIKSSFSKYSNVWFTDKCEPDDFFSNSHAWFGINIGAQDWTEEWISEGFATYMEDSIYAKATLIKDVMYKAIQNTSETNESISQEGVAKMGMTGNTCEGDSAKIGQDQVGVILNQDGLCDWNHYSYNISDGKVMTGSSVTLPPSLVHKVTKMNYLEELSDLRAHIRYRTLTSELENSSEDLQKLRPMQGETLVDDSGIGYVKDGRNPEKNIFTSALFKGIFPVEVLKQNNRQGNI